MASYPANSIPAKLLFFTLFCVELVFGGCIQEKVFLEHEVSPIVITAANDHFLLDLDGATGGFLRIASRQPSLQLLSREPEPAPPWRINLVAEQPISSITAFSVNRGVGPGISFDLSWRTDFDIDVKASISAAPRAPELKMSLEVENNSSHVIASVDFPLLTGIGPLDGHGESDRLAHPHGTGYLFKNPFELFKGGVLVPPALSAVTFSSGVVESIYPTGVEGAGMQFMAYYAEEKGGFMIWTRDNAANRKAFNFFKSASDLSLTALVRHYASPTEPGNDLRPGYEILLATMKRGTWQEAADKYKEWGVEQGLGRRETAGFYGNPDVDSGAFPKGLLSRWTSEGRCEKIPLLEYVYGD